MLFLKSMPGLFHCQMLILNFQPWAVQIGPCWNSRDHLFSWGGIQRFVCFPSTSEGQLLYFWFEKSRWFCRIGSIRKAYSHCRSRIKIVQHVCFIQRGKKKMKKTSREKMFSPWSFSTHQGGSAEAHILHVGLNKSCRKTKKCQMWPSCQTKCEKQGSHARQAF